MVKEAEKYLQLMDRQYYKSYGKVVKVVGLTIESVGPKARMGDLCKIYPNEKEEEYVIAEVVGFQDSRLILMPVDSVEGVGTGCIVENTGHPLSVLVGEELLGHTLDGIGRMTDGTEEIHGSYYPLENTPPDPMDRRIISEVLPLGVKAVDGLITVGKGQRIGVFAGSGVGKSTLLGMFASNKCAKTATAVAEYFRDQGKDVLLMMDSMTRFSQAQREIGLASGEPPVTRGYPPSVYAQMPKLLERAGTNEKGSITGLYTVLVDGDDFNEPITDTARGILDGHIVLDRKLGHKNHYPAIDILQSISRVMNSSVTKEHKALAGKLKQVLATYSEAEDLINIGAYKNGSNPDIDYAIRMNKEVNEFLCQDTEEKFACDEEVELLKKVFDD